MSLLFSFALQIIYSLFNSGLICYVNAVAGDSCRKFDVGPYGYPVRTTGQCVVASASGRTAIGDSSTCRKALTSMRLSLVFDTSLNINNGVATGATGCSITNGGGGYNSFANDLSCSVNYPCICITAPVCTNTNAAVANTDTCFCGSTTCTSENGLYCSASSNTCSPGIECEKVNSDKGEIENTIDCACGTKSCNSINGLYCFASGNTCSPVPIPICSKTDGSALNSVACFCGSNNKICDDHSKYCYAANNKCSPVAIPDCKIVDGSAFNNEPCTCGELICDNSHGFICVSNSNFNAVRHTSFGNYGYTIIVTGNCEDQPGRIKLTLSLCRQFMRENYGFVGQDNEFDVENEPKLPAGCTIHGYDVDTDGNPRGGFNRAENSGGTCDSVGEGREDSEGNPPPNTGCICLGATPCEKDTGTAPNDNSCLCGSNLCHHDQGEIYCTASTSRCAVRPSSTCTSNTGTTANNNDCKCDLSDCTEDTGFWCISSINFCGEKCGAGSYRNATTNGACVECSAGRWDARTDVGLTSNDDCLQRCSPGTYSDETGLSGDNQCKQCIAGLWSSARGLTSATAW